MAPLANHILMWSNRGFGPWFLVPPVVTTDYRIHVNPVPHFPISWVWFLDGDIYRDRPLVLGWQGRIDPP